MKSIDEVRAAVVRRLARSWQADITGSGEQWPHTFSLGTASKSELEQDFGAVVTWSREWHTLVSSRDGLDLREVGRRVHGTDQLLPTHLTVNTVAAAAELGGLPWTTRLARAWDRYDRLRTDFPACAELERVLRATDQYTDADFNLLCTAATWFANHNADGLTPRQVPVPGLHAKWLNTSQHLVATLAGRDALGLAAPHPARVHFTYLDPEHLTAGGRRHDCISVGDNAEPAYTPKVVLISENKDTAVVLGPVPGGIAVEGGGFGGATAAALPWISACPVLLYWGDIDPSGYEILNGFRQAGLKVVSILMDQATYYAHEKFGSHTDKNGAPIQPSQRRTLPFLTPDEASMYERLTDPTWTRARRIEQERIPLGAATLAITAAAQLGSPAQ